MTVKKLTDLFNKVTFLSLVLVFTFISTNVINANPSTITDAMINAGLADLNEAFSKTGKYDPYWKWMIFNN